MIETYNKFCSSSCLTKNITEQFLRDNNLNNGNFYEDIERRRREQQEWSQREEERIRNQWRQNQGENQQNFINQKQEAINWLENKLTEKKVSEAQLNQKLGTSDWRILIKGLNSLGEILPKKFQIRNRIDDLYMENYSNSRDWQNPTSQNIREREKKNWPLSVFSFSLALYLVFSFTKIKSH